MDLKEELLSHQKTVEYIAAISTILLAIAWVKNQHKASAVSSPTAANSSGGSTGNTGPLAYYGGSGSSSPAPDYSTAINTIEQQVQALSGQQTSAAYAAAIATANDQANVAINQSNNTLAAQIAAISAQAQTAAIQAANNISLSFAGNQSYGQESINTFGVGSSASSSGSGSSGVGVTGTGLGSISFGSSGSSGSTSGNTWATQAGEQTIQDAGGTFTFSGLNASSLGQALAAISGNVTQEANLAYAAQGVGLTEQANNLLTVHQAQAGQAGQPSWFVTGPGGNYGGTYGASADNLVKQNSGSNSGSGGVPIQ